METKPQIDPPVALDRLVRRWGRLIYIVWWDMKGHWITTQKGHRNDCWLLVGPCTHPDGKRCFSVLVGPLGISLGILPPNAIGEARAEIAIPPQDQTL